MLAVRVPRESESRTESFLPVLNLRLHNRECFNTSAINLFQSELKNKKTETRQR